MLHMRLLKIREHSLFFNTTSPENDLQGSLSAVSLFAQSQVLPAHVKDGDRQPHLNKPCVRVCYSYNP